MTSVAKFDTNSTKEMKQEILNCIPAVIRAVNDVFSDVQIENNWNLQKERIFNVLNEARLPAEEIAHYTFIDRSVPYTRNLIYTDDVNYTLILLCWNPRQESKIHNHPCNGGFVKTIRGSIKETRYHTQEKVLECGTVEKYLHEDSAVCTTVNQVVYIDDYMGYHKIGCASDDEPAITLHLYSPPYSSCKIWPDPSNYDKAEVVSMKYDSLIGVRI